MTATHATVTINSIHVIDSSVTTTAEPGSSAEWYMTFFVNGQIAKWSHDEVKDDTLYAVNRQFPNVPLGENGMISIQVSGYEHDTTSANDPLPTLTMTFHPADEFQLGSTGWAFSPVSPEGSYKIEYTIMPARDPGQALVADNRTFVTLYRAGTGGYALWSGNWKSFTDKWNELSASGLRLARLATFRADTDLLTFGDSTERYFVGTFVPGTDGYALWASDWTAFEAKWKELSAQGLRLVDLTPYLDGNKRMFAGVFRASTDAHALWVSEWPSFEKKWKELTEQGLRLVALDTYKDGTKRMFTGVYRAGQYGHFLWVGANWQSFMTKRLELQLAGQRLIDIASYSEGGEQLYAGVFRAGNDRAALKSGSWNDFVSDWQQLSNNGMRLISVDTYIDGQEE